MPFIPVFSLKPFLQSYHDMGFFSSQLFRISFMDVKKTSSPRNPLHKHINTAAAKHDISLFRVFNSLFHSMSSTTNRAITISLVTPKSCFLINVIRILYHIMNFSNHGTQVGHSVSVNFLPSLFKNDVRHFQHSISIYILAYAVWDFPHVVPLQTSNIYPLSQRQPQGYTCHYHKKLSLQHIVTHRRLFTFC